MIEIRDIVPKLPPIKPIKAVFNADIVPGESIRLFGENNERPFDITFKLGDLAIYSMISTGPIVTISENTVAIHRQGWKKYKRLSLYTFSLYNYKFVK
jgi:hypothetical protein